MYSQISITQVEISATIIDAYDEIAEWLELKHKVDPEEFLKTISQEIFKLKSIKSHKKCQYDSLKAFGDYCYLIKPCSKKIYIIYNIVENTMFIKYIKPCSQAYDYSDI